MLTSHTNFYKKMADINEEAAVEKVQAAEPVEQTKKEIDPSLDGIRLFYEKNKKLVTYGGGGLLVLIIAIFAYKFYYLPQVEEEAANEIFWAQNYFEKDSFNIALKGGVQVYSAQGQKAMMGFEQVAEEFSGTKSGSLAHYCAGICLLRTGKYEQAIEHLNQYDGNDEIVAPIAIGAIGDCHMELNHVDEAINYYLKAADKSHNKFTTPVYLKKAGFAYEQKAQYAQALEVYERIKKEFSTSTEGKEIARDIAKVKALGNL